MSLAEAEQLPRPDAADRAGSPRPVATRRALLACVACGASIDLVLHARGVGIGAALLPMAMAGALLVARTVPNRRARWLLLPILGVSPWIAVRASPTLHALDLVASFGLLALAAGAGAGRFVPPALTDGGRTALGHLGAGLANAPQFIADGIRVGVRADRRTIAAVGRGLLVAVPLTIVISSLLASADDTFASLVGVGSLPTVGRHALLIVCGAAAAAALCRCALTARAASTAPSPTVGGTEASVILVMLVAVYAVFVVARVVHTAADQQVEQLADEARAGFFQLVAVVVITVAVLCGARTFVATRHRSFIVLVSSLGALTLAIVGVALLRLDRYRDEFGLTELRLATTWFSVWLAVVVVAVTSSFFIGRFRWPRLVFGAALVWLVAWNAYDPDQQVASTNLHRAIDGERFDADFIASLSDDAMPVVVARIDELPTAARNAAYNAVCARPMPAVGSALGWNHARATSRQAVQTLCG